LQSSPISKETIKTFLIFLTLGAVIVLSVNTYILVENQKRILDNQEIKGLPLSNDSNKKITHVEDMITSLSEKIGKFSLYMVKMQA
jgi:hypothetical protein